LNNDARLDPISGFPANSSANCAELIQFQTRSGQEKIGEPLASNEHVLAISHRIATAFPLGLVTRLQRTSSRYFICCIIAYIGRPQKAR
jgi:hypothetical protein